MGVGHGGFSRIASADRTTGRIASSQMFLLLSDDLLELLAIVVQEFR